MDTAITINMVNGDKGKQNRCNFKRIPLTLAWCQEQISTISLFQSFEKECGWWTSPASKQRGGGIQWKDITESRWEKSNKTVDRAMSEEQREGVEMEEKHKI